MGRFLLEGQVSLGGRGGSESSPVPGPAEGSERGPLLLLAFGMTGFVGEWGALEIALVWEGGLAAEVLSGPCWRV